MTARVFDDRLSKEWKIFKATLGPVAGVVTPGSIVSAQFATAGRTPIYARTKFSKAVIQLGPR